VAVDDVSFDVYPGECVGIVAKRSGQERGRAFDHGADRLSGPDKKTASSNSNGRNLREAPPEQLRQLRGQKIGIISRTRKPRSTRSSRSGRQMIDCRPRASQVSKDEAAALAIEKHGLVGISAPEIADACLPVELSGGQRQRVAIRHGRYCSVRS